MVTNADANFIFQIYLLTEVKEPSCLGEIYKNMSPDHLQHLSDRFCKLMISEQSLLYFFCYMFKNLYIALPESVRAFGNSLQTHDTHVVRCCISNVGERFTIVLLLCCRIKPLVEALYSVLICWCKQAITRDSHGVSCLSLTRKGHSWRNSVGQSASLEKIDRFWVEAFVHWTTWL